MDTPKGPKHTRYTALAQLHPESVLRNEPMTDRPSKNRDYSKDSIATTVVCHRPGKVSGEVEFLTFQYRNGDHGITYRFPTETGEQELNETPELVALACLAQEILGSENRHPPKIGARVREDIRPSDPARGSRPQNVETLGVPEWVEAGELMDRMLQRGIKSHRDSLVSAMEWLANQDFSVACHYAKYFREWGVE